LSHYITPFGSKKCKKKTRYFRLEKQLIIIIETKTVFHFSHASKVEPQGGEVHIQDLLLLDVLPLSLGIEDIHGHMCIIAERNRTIPFKTQRYAVFTNAYAYQTSAIIRVFSGQHKLTQYNVRLKKSSIRSDCI
jgi:molecular chaperone DnaK (HSP70)